MSPRELFALRDHLDPDLKDRFVADARRAVSLSEIVSFS